MENNNTISTNFNFHQISGTTSNFNMWNNPIFKEVNEVGESIEMIYTQTSTCSITCGMSPYPDERAVKIVFSCIDGKWNKSEPVYGKIIAPQDEYYDFE